MSILLIDYLRVLNGLMNIFIRLHNLHVQHNNIQNSKCSTGKPEWLVAEATSIMPNISNVIMYDVYY